jgi:hypothetical protein
MLKHLEKNKILTNLNHGFRSGYSFETQLLTTINDFLQEHDKGHQIDVAILDFSKAFDTVPHNHFFALNLRAQSFAHISSCSKSACSFWWSFAVLIVLYSKQSSANSLTEDA